VTMTLKAAKNLSPSRQSKRGTTQRSLEAWAAERAVIVWAVGNRATSATAAATVSDLPALDGVCFAGMSIRQTEPSPASISDSMRRSKVNFVRGPALLPFHQVRGGGSRLSGRVGCSLDRNNFRLSRAPGEQLSPGSAVRLNYRGCLAAAQ